MIKHLLIIVFIGMSVNSFSQKVIELPFTKNPNTIYKTSEKAYISKSWDTEVITNVSVPTMEVFLPNRLIATGTAVIIAPGGGLYAHSIETEGNMIAKWLNTKGIAAFVLKYRLVPTGEEAIKEMAELGQKDQVEFRKRVLQTLPDAVNDGLNAINYVRKNAKELNVDPSKIGFMGFSAGGLVTMGVTYNYTIETRPDFIVPVYPWLTFYPSQEVPKDAPPMLVVCASDDPLELAPESIRLYNDWLKAQKSVGLHMYAKGGHGFGLRPKGLPSDKWIEHFYEWAKGEGF